MLTQRAKASAMASISNVGTRKNFVTLLRHDTPRRARAHPVAGSVRGIGATVARVPTAAADVSATRSSEGSPVTFLPIVAFKSARSTTSATTKIGAANLSRISEVFDVEIVVVPRPAYVPALLPSNATATPAMPPMAAIAWRA